MVYKTESRLPAGFAPEDLGQAAIVLPTYTEPLSALGELDPLTISFALVSYLSSPLTLGNGNEYVVFVPDATLAAEVDRFQWEVHRLPELAFSPILIASESTSDGVWEYLPAELGAITVTVRLLSASGQVLGSVQLRQSVVPYSPLFAEAVTNLATDIDRLQAQWKPDITIGNVKATNELANDFYDYIHQAVLEPIDGQPNQIPWQLVASIAYREMFFSPKESPTGTSWNKPNRSNELSLYRNYLNGTSWGLVDVEDWSLGIGQIQPQSLATYLSKPPGTTPYTDFLQEDRQLHDGALQAEARLNAYLELDPDDRIDLFNLLRFPKSHVRMCNIVLHKLKNRDHRVPEMTAAELLQDRKAVELIATEYNQGPTTTPYADAGSNSYGRELYTILTSPMVAALPSLSNLVLDVWGVVLSTGGTPLANVRVDVYETLVIASTALKCWKHKEDFKEASAPSAQLIPEAPYRVLEVQRNYVHGDGSLDLVRISFPAAPWDGAEGWIVARDGSTNYANLLSSREQDVARTDNLGRFKLTRRDKLPARLHFVKEPNPQGSGYFDGESTWAAAPAYHKVVMEPATSMVREADFVALLQDWPDYNYPPLINNARSVNYPAHYYLGEDNRAIRGYKLDEVADLWIDCNSFTQALITQAWFQRYPQLRWNFTNWQLFQITVIAGVTDWHGPITAALAGDGTIEPAVPVDLSAPNALPPPWSLIQGWHVAGTQGHSFLVVDSQPASGKVLILESNLGDLDGVGLRNIGRIEFEQRDGVIFPNRDRLWIEKDVPTWADTLAYYSATADAVHNPSGETNPLGIARLKLYDLQWSGVQVL